MLALAYAAAHPDRSGPLVLVGCGTFDAVSRAQMQETRRQRQTPAYHRQVARITAEVHDAAERLRLIHEAGAFIDNYDPLPSSADPDATIPPFDLQAHLDTWNDMLKMQQTGIYPAAFAAITAPVIMLHGAYDPHPGTAIYDSLKPIIPQLEYHAWEQCGHSPWAERMVRDDFFAVLKAWLREHCEITPAPPPGEGTVVETR
jgi:pimeloyl-ACP methyl ester carboxylesterase